MIHSLDENIGRVIAKVDELGLAENTLIIFTSDNGGPYEHTRNWPLRAGKGSYFEGGWEKGDTIRFLALNENGEKEGDDLRDC